MTRVEMNTEMLKILDKKSKADDVLSGIFVCLVDISQSLAQIADNSDHLNPFYGLYKEEDYGLCEEDHNGTDEC